MSALLVKRAPLTRLGTSIPSSGFCNPRPRAKNSSIWESLYFEYLSGIALNHLTLASKEFLVEQHKSYTKELNMIEHLIIKGEVITWDDIEASIFL